MSTTPAPKPACSRCKDTGWIYHGFYRAETPCTAECAAVAERKRAEAEARPSAHDIARARLAERRAARLAAHKESAGL